MVVTCPPCAIMTGMMQVRIAAPSTCMVQAPQMPMPQPNLLPDRFKCSRTTHSSGTSSGPSNSAGIPFTKNFTDISGNLSGVGAESIFRERHHVEPTPGRVEQGLRQRGSNRRQDHFTETLRRTIAGQHDWDDLRHLIDAQQLIVEEVALVGTALREGNSALEDRGQRKPNSAFDLRLERVRIDHKTRIDRAEYPLDREALADARQLHDLRDIGFEPSAAADVAIIRNAPERIRRRVPAGCLRSSVEYA